MANKVLRIILVIVIFLVFFEVGLISSYTIVTAEAPDVPALINMQVSSVTSFFSPQNVNNALVKDPTQLNISNNKDVALKMEELSNVDGVNVESMNITTYDDTDNEEITVNIEALGYASPNTSNSQIVISQDPSYKIIATGNATLKSGVFKVDPNTVSINSVLKLY